MAQQGSKWDVKKEKKTFCSIFFSFRTDDYIGNMEDDHHAQRSKDNDGWDL